LTRERADRHAGTPASGESRSAQSPDQAQWAAWISISSGPRHFRVDERVEVASVGSRELEYLYVKDAMLETRITIRVPLHVETGETIEVDTRTGQFVGRVS
jgi:hypothetical protein